MPCRMEADRGDGWEHVPAIRWVPQYCWATGWEGEQKPKLASTRRQHGQAQQGEVWVGRATPPHPLEEGGSPKHGPGLRAIEPIVKHFGIKFINVACIFTLGFPARGRGGLILSWRHLPAFSPKANAYCCNYSSVYCV